MASIGLIAKRGLALAWPKAALVRGRKADKRIALTFDDGPHPINTARILDILDEEEAKATFFLQGSEAEKYPGLVDEIARRGHEIGNHGYSHLSARRVPWRTYVEEVDRTQRILKGIVGEATGRLFRPPFGEITPLTFLRLAVGGYRFIFWSADSRDSFIREPAALAAHIDALPVDSGDILLFHEDYGHMVAALPRILKSLKARGLKFGWLEDL